MKKRIITAALAAAMLAAAPTALAAVTETAVADIKTGSGRSDIHAVLGTPAEQSANGIKERFDLSSGGSAVLIYNEWGYLSRGYIVR